MTALLLRWSWRDLRTHWVQVIVIALILAVGTGSFAAFNSMTRWRRASNEASYALTAVHDLRARLSPGDFVPAGTLAAAAATIPGADAIAAASERVITPTQVEATPGGAELLVRGLVIGVEVRDGGPPVDRLHIERGRGLTAADAGADVGVLEYNFARHYALPPAGTVRLAGGRTLDYVGHAIAPEYFLIVTEEGGLLAEASFAAVFTSLETAARIAGRPGMVNDLVLRLHPGADRDRVQAALSAALAPLGATVLTIDDDPSYTTVLRDVEGDQQSTTAITIAILVGAVFAAFNLTARMVEAQRREIGVAMALGVAPRRIAVRPLLVGIQIALLGVVLGIGIGLLFGLGVRALLQSVMALPVTETPFQFDIYLRAAALGVTAPLIAISYPVWRAVRVVPVEAIRTGHRAVRGRGLAPWLRRLPLPGGSLVRMPFRNVMRSPRRTLLAALGIGATIAVLVAVLGVLDAFTAAAAGSDRALSGEHPERMIVELDGVYALDAERYRAIVASAALTRVEPVTRLPATLRAAEAAGDAAVDVLLDFVDFGSALWRPALRAGAPLASGDAGVVIARKAARDLDVAVGERVRVRHPLRTAEGTRVVESELVVRGIHDNPFRTYAYADRSQLTLTGLAGTANQLSALPAAGLGESDVKRALFALPSVASVQSAGGLARAFTDVLEEFAAIFYLMEAAALGLAGLIAFNSASITADERRREHATMFAFGTPVRTVLGLAMVENALLGIAGTGAGIAAGAIFAEWFARTIVARTAPDLGLDPGFSAGSFALVIVLGVGVVAVTPVFMIRRLRRMDIPSTLRVME